MDAFLENVLDEQRPGEIPDFVEMTKARVNGRPDPYSQSVAHGSENSSFDRAKSLFARLRFTYCWLETSSTTTEWAMAELLHNPEWIEKLQQEIEIVVGRDRMVEESDLAKLELVNAVIKETFRLHPRWGCWSTHIPGASTGCGL
ncbi:hypothetical protein JRQ81_000040 [Phrynocephalus forsythii]|uniref:Uncharacterized protein n=1 Tax=Phrynocephalus forsythii TaxID=171643 RepID=A0A9Q1APQ3_9SAUR|nr:hypothetical protein JRQ81_000040 [Phrynocephalus forsythii]